MDVITRTKSFVKWRWKITRITFLSLFYNEHLSGDYVFDTLMQPAFWFVDHFTKILGPLFVLLVIFLTVILLHLKGLLTLINLFQSSVVIIVYWIGLPYYLQYKNGHLLTGWFYIYLNGIT